MNQFVFQTSNRVIFGINSIHLISEHIQQFGKRVLIISSRKQLVEEILAAELKKYTCTIISSHGEPNIHDVTELSMLARKIAPDCIVGIGGGSVIDTAKAVSAFMTNQKDPTTYLEVIGNAQPLTEQPCPVVAVPTTSGTGSEVTKNTVIKVPELKIKVSLRSEKIFPRVAIIDPSLTFSLPPSISAGTGMDALTQLIEPFISKKANIYTDVLCIEGIKRISSSILKVVEDGEDSSARSDLSFASLLGGMALTNAGLGVVHGFAGVLGGMYDAPHGFLCARLLPAVFEMNYREIINKPGFFELQEKMRIISSLVTKNDQSTVAKGIERLYKLVDQLSVPVLNSLGVNKSDFPLIVEKAKKSSSIKGNPIELSDKSLINILETSF